MPPSSNPRYWLQRRANKRTGFPAATLLYYGPDETRASKVVVGIVATSRDRDPSDVRKWFSDTADLRNDAATAAEILAYLDQHRVERVISMDRIFGCPHEEGIDYPEGETCPSCPYWANRDRFTGQRIDG